MDKRPNYQLDMVASFVIKVWNAYEKWAQWWSSYVAKTFIFWFFTLTVITANHVSFKDFTVFQISYNTQQQTRTVKGLWKLKDSISHVLMNVSFLC